MTWRCLKCRRERPDNEWTQWVCREGGTCVSGLAPAPSDPWDAFRPLALPEDGPPLPGCILVTFNDGTRAWRGTGVEDEPDTPTIKFGDIRRSPEYAAIARQPVRAVRRYIEGMIDLGEAYAAEEAPFNLDRGGR